MKTGFLGFIAVLCIGVFSNSLLADIAVNIDVPNGRGDGDAADATLLDFQTQNPGALLDASTTLLISGGAGNGDGWTNLNTTTTIGAFTVTTTGGANGFNAGDVSHNDVNPITEGYNFGVATGSTLTISGLAAATSAGDTIVLGAWGIGDNIGQGASFGATYAASTLTGSTVYNGGGARSDATGSIPFVNFSYVADGTTDSIVLEITGGGRFNAFSLSTTPATVPEPTGVLALGLAGIAGLMRRRRK